MFLIYSTLCKIDDNRVFVEKIMVWFAILLNIMKVDAGKVGVPRFLSEYLEISEPAVNFASHINIIANEERAFNSHDNASDRVVFSLSTIGHSDT